MRAGFGAPTLRTHSRRQEVGAEGGMQAPRPTSLRTQSPALAATATATVIAELPHVRQRLIGHPGCYCGEAENGEEDRTARHRRDHHESLKLRHELNRRKRLRSSDGAYRDRTGDLLVANQVLSQLS